MAKLVYDNIFESVVRDKKKAAQMDAASNVLIDLDTVLLVVGIEEEQRRDLIRAVRRLHFKRYR